jgi:hypothetical protein
MPVPPFDHSGILPPYVGRATASAERSPYASTMDDVVARFATSQARREILGGLIEYRAALSSELGITTGIQWLDGSFVEDVERMQARPPVDVDVVTIASFPRASGLTGAQRALLDSRQTKARFHCDAYPLDLARVGSMEQLIKNVTYWFGLFSHRRDGRWKGLTAVPLDAADDARARHRLAVTP